MTLENHGGRGETGPSARERLLDAATEVFAGSGFASGTVREITLRASVNIAAVNYHFSSKAALYQAAIDRALERAFLPLGDTTTQVPHEHALVRAIVSDLVDGSLRGAAPPYIRLLAGELQRPTGALRGLVRSAIERRLHRQWAPEAASSTSANGEEDGLLVAHWILGSCLTVLQLAPEAAYGTSPDATARQSRLVDRLTRLIAEGLAGSTA
jgi:TetR/AcrR family transcriptional regulator, regulator of cefoperazone and chloramphenicol sensitivity